MAGRSHQYGAEYRSQSLQDYRAHYLMHAMHSRAHPVHHVDTWLRCACWRKLLAMHPMDSALGSWVARSRVKDVCGCIRQVMVVEFTCL